MSNIIVIGDTNDSITNKIIDNIDGVSVVSIKELKSEIEKPELGLLIQNITLNMVDCPEYFRTFSKQKKLCSSTFQHRKGAFANGGRG